MTNQHLPHTLPQHLAERTIPLNELPINPDGAFVLCWLHHAIRDHDNPAFDVAISIANDLHKPVLVYQGLGGNHRFNADRHHVFIMQGAAELQSQLADRDIASVFHLPQDPASPSPLRDLAQQAAAIITEDFPAPPFPKWSAALAKHAPVSMLAVDSSCIMPIREHTKRHTRAFKFRDTAKKQWARRIPETWTNVEPTQPTIDTTNIASWSVSLQDQDFDQLAAACKIDHHIPPSPCNTGGSDAGYQRWNNYKANHLRAYDRTRNNALNLEAVSRLSPYLHYGHVSPFRIAREAQAIGGKGSEKFLDELLVWRELAFNFCAFTKPDTLETLHAIPDWAAETLKRHEQDPREDVYDWETLTRGSTNDSLWNAAQHSLTRNGELHNNLRMSWGKMLPQWTRSPEDALRYLIDLNHRFALDGNNPNSYGGLLWCLGQFDRPFDPEQPVLGTVRPRDTKTHAERLDPSEYAQAVTQLNNSKPLRIAVIGAGIAGLAAARALQDQAQHVSVFDKSRGFGGRTSTRRTEIDGANTFFDHGAPEFQVTDPRFGRYARAWLEAGVCSRWDPRAQIWQDGEITEDRSERPRLVATPGMNALAAYLGRDLNVTFNTRISKIDHSDGTWSLTTDDDQTHADFDALVVAIPAPQAIDLVADHTLTDELAAITYDPCLTALFAPVEDIDFGWDLLTVKDHPVVAKVIRNQSKPSRKRPAWIIHASKRYSDACLERDLEESFAELIDAFEDVVGAGSIRTNYGRAHRWRHARVSTPHQAECLFDRAISLAICSDGFAQEDQELGIQAAFLSGHAAAGRLLATRLQTSDPTKLF